MLLGMKTNPKRILIVLTSHDTLGATGKPTGAYLPEVAHPYDVFTRAGYEVDLASIRGGKVPLDGLDRTDDVSAAFLELPRVRRQLAESAPLGAIDPARYDAFFLAGGHGTMWDFPDAPGIQRAAAAIWEAGGVVGAVCHGPAGLLEVRLSNGEHLVRGRAVNGFTNAEEAAVKLDGVVPFALETELGRRGARFEGGPLWQTKVVTDGRLVTGQNPASATGVAEAMVRVLGEVR